MSFSISFSFTRQGRKLSLQQNAFREQNEKRTFMDPRHVFGDSSESAGGTEYTRAVAELSEKLLGLSETGQSKFSDTGHVRVPFRQGESPEIFCSIPQERSLAPDRLT